ncbi:MAG: helix-hairpin-helix domain-containing protein, partial [Myxococcota bacterium]
IAQLTVRGGHPVGTTNHSFSGQEFPTPELLASFLTQRYAATSPNQLPDDIILGVDLGQDAATLAQHLSERRGKRVRVRVPIRGQAVKLLQICQKNADCALQSRLKQQDLARDCLERLRALLGLANIPRRIECFDVSLFQGSDPMASQVCFVDGIPAKARYRLFHVKTVQGMDDYAMLHEVLLRRLKRGLRDDDLPDLLLVDGGKGQLGVALAACKDLGITADKRGFYVAGIAKARLLRGSAAKGAGESERVEWSRGDPVVQERRDAMNRVATDGEHATLSFLRKQESRKKPEKRDVADFVEIPGVYPCENGGENDKDGDVPHGEIPAFAGMTKKSFARQDDKSNSSATSANGDSNRPDGTGVNTEDLIKRSPERLFIPGVKDPIVLRSHTPERYLVERIRDEAHRFAITAHRAKRKRRTLRSALDTIPGVGPARRRLLLKHLGSLAAVRQASTAALGQVPGIGPELAKQIQQALTPDQKGRGA